MIRIEIAVAFLILLFKVSIFFNFVFSILSIVNANLIDDWIRTVGLWATTAHR